MTYAGGSTNVTSMQIAGPKNVSSGIWSMLGASSDGSRWQSASTCVGPWSHIISPCEWNENPPSKRETVSSWVA